MTALFHILPTSAFVTFIFFLIHAILSIHMAIISLTTTRINHKYKDKKKQVKRFAA
jgi:hypothetical protein